MKFKLLLILLIMIGLTGCGENTTIGGNTSSTGDNTPVEEKPVEEPDIKAPTKVVSISENKGLNEVVIDGVTIKNVVIVNDEEKQRVEFTLESDTPLTNMLIEVSLLNDTVVNRSMNLTVGDNEYSKFVIFDFTNNYNDPFQIYFNIEKN